ncbi:hypothetical protein IPL68_00020 [Candidatus Saccharibacteria bacterium]|nr:MAG: hypothetical protein IPL68_00020 [Candidatus Saccharibacteria bacterium]
MKYSLSERGTGHIVAFLLVVVVAVVGFVGYTVMNSQDNKDNTVSTQQKVEAVPELKQADATLSDANNELETGLDTTALDQDIDAML